MAEQEKSKAKIIRRSSRRIQLHLTDDEQLIVDRFEIGIIRAGKSTTEILLPVITQWLAENAEIVSKGENLITSEQLNDIVFEKFGSRLLNTQLHYLRSRMALGGDYFVTQRGSKKEYAYNADRIWKYIVKFFESRIEGGLSEDQLTPPLKDKNLHVRIKGSKKPEKGEPDEEILEGFRPLGTITGNRW